jgi:Xaa-Pro aminopeptidase
MRLMLSLTPEGCRARREHLIATAGADLLVIQNPRHIFYLTGLFSTPLLLSAWGPLELLIDSGTGQATLIAHDAIQGQAANAFVDEVVIWPWYNAAKATGAGGDLFGDGLAALNAHLPDLRGKRLGVEMGWLPHGTAIANAVNLNPVLAALRRRKQADELALIREAIAVTEAGHAAARQAIRPGLTELDVFNAIQTALNEAYGQAVHLMGDFVSGERARLVGGFASPRVLQPGEVMIIDLFPLVNGYRADFTATLPVSESVTPEQARLDTALHEALAAAEAVLRPGAGAAEVYRAVKQALAAHQLDGHFPHHAGHGLGLDHPEAPYFVPDSDEVLVEGDVVTLEPGAYGQRFAGRIEHNYRITAAGFERMTHHQTRLY